MTQEAEVLSCLIGQVYDAALDRALWPSVLTKSFEFVGGSGAALFSRDKTAPRGNVVYDVGIDPYYRQLYCQKYIALDPSTTRYYFAEIEQPVGTADVIPYDEFLETRFYREWVRPQELIDFASTVLDKSGTSAAKFVVFRHERNGVVDDETRRRMRLIVPHIRRAALIGRMFDLGTAEAATFADTLDGLNAGICLVDAGGRIVHANAAGHEILATGNVLRAVGGRLVACDAQIDRTLRDVFVAAGQGNAALGSKGISVPLSSSPADLWLAHVLPLTSGIRRNAGMTYSAVAALFIRKAVLEVPSAIETISKLYKLTPSELRVLATLSEAGGVSLVATALGISEATVKTHLQHLFAKTGTTRQTELVKLVAAHASPIGG